MPSGYSGTPLAKKLGYEPGFTAWPFVDIKVCTVDETWSGLELEVLKELRGG